MAGISNKPGAVSDTGREYDTWEQLVGAESNGYVALIVFTDSKRYYPVVMGPFDTFDEAHTTRQQLRRKYLKELGRGFGKTYVRHAWKE